MIRLRKVLSIEDDEFTHLMIRETIKSLASEMESAVDGQKSCDTISDHSEHSEPISIALQMPNVTRIERPDMKGLAQKPASAGILLARIDQYCASPDITAWDE